MERTSRLVGAVVLLGAATIASGPVDPAFSATGLVTPRGGGDAVGGHHQDAMRTASGGRGGRARGQRLAVGLGDAAEPDLERDGQGQG